MLHWTHVPEAPDRTLEEQMWRIIANPQSEPSKIRQHGLRASLIVAAMCLPLAGSVAWGAAYILGLAR
jgi:hypothetical protein